MSELVDLFRTDGGSRLLALRAARANRDLRAVAASAHTLRGSAGNLGGKRLAALIGRLETAAKNGDTAQVDGLLPAVDSAFAAFLSALSAYR